MIREALQFLADMAVKSAKAQQIDVEFIDDDKWQVTNAFDGTVNMVDLKPRNFGTVFSINDLATVAARTDEFNAVYVSEKKVVLQIGGTDRPTHRWVLPLRVNPVIEILKNLRSLSHQALMQKLRIDLGSTVTAPDDFCARMSYLKIAKNEESISVARKGDESLGKSVRAMVTGENKIPDVVQFIIPIYQDVFPDLKWSIECGVVINSLEGTVSIIPLGGEIERVMVLAMRAVAYEVENAFAKQGMAETSVICGTFCE